jgi:acyl carrier protein
MTDALIQQRLLSCFQAVFPDTPEAALSNACIDTLPTWDSVAQVTLITVVEEEFSIAIDPERYEELTSFRAFVKVMDGAGK